MATMLVVDDRAINRLFMVSLLGYAGHVTLEASDGVEALAIARAERPQLIISDVLMPRMDGVEFATRLKADPQTKDIPVVFYTATYRIREARELAARCGVEAVLTKPSEPQAILDTVNGILGLAPCIVAQEPDACAQPAAFLQDPVAADGKVLVRSRMQRAMTLKVAALLEVGIELASERDPEIVLEKFCGALQDVLGARYCGVGLLDESGAALARVAARGLNEAQLGDLARWVPGAGTLTSVLSAGSAVRSGAPGLPVSHPPVKSFLAARVASAAHVFGWLYVAGGPDDRAFDADDEQLAVTMAATLALNYENAQLLEGLRASEQRFRQLAEHIHEVFFLISADWSQMVYVSPAYEEVWGRSRDSLYREPTSWLEGIHPEDRRHIAVPLKQAAEDSFEHTCRVIRPDGSMRWVWARGFGVRDGSGKVVRYAGIAEDITKRVAMQRTLKESRAGLMRAQQMARLAHVVTGQDGVFETWSETLSGMLGVEEAALPRTARAWMRHVHPEDKARVRTVLIHGVREYQRAQVDYRLVQRGGPVRHVRQVVEPLGAPADKSGDNHWFSTIQDITQEKLDAEAIMRLDMSLRLNATLERRVAERTAELTEANKGLEAFNYSASHDLRGPLNRINGFARMLEEDCREKLDETEMNRLAVIQRSAEDMARLLDNLLAFSSLGRRPVQGAPVNMTALVKSVLDDLDGQAPGYAAAEISLQELPRGQGDVVLLRQVWVNLLNNALKFSSRGARPKVEIGGEVRNGRAVYRVRDNGAGFDPAQGDRLFQAFKRLHTASQFPGTGLGLAIVHRIVTQHGGTVCAESAIGMGATFTFEIPLATG